MRQFVADASHELRTPLTTIRGFAELYRQGAAREPGADRGLLRRIEDEAARMGLLVEDLLLLARLDQERPLDAGAGGAAGARHATRSQAARAVAPDRTIELEIARDPSRWWSHGDDARLRQVIGNLMTNALTHTPPDAPVTAAAALRGREPGRGRGRRHRPGLAPEQAERVFERFYRADAARTRRAERRHRHRAGTGHRRRAGRRAPGHGRGGRDARRGRDLPGPAAAAARVRR